MYGVVDIGSNTMRLSCYRVVDRRLIPVFQKKNMAGLAGYVDDKNCLSGRGIKRAVEILEDFKNIVMCVGLDKLYVIATASLRNVENTEEILEEILESTGILVQVLSGREEAMYDFKGVSYCMEADSGIVVDIGGGSTELVEFQGEKIDKASSVAMGSLNMFTRFVDDLLPTQKEEKEIREYVGEELSRLDIGKQKLVLGVGGTNRGCLKLYNDFYKLNSQNVEMECEKIRAMFEKIRSGKKGGMTRILKIVPDRVHTMIPGMIILDEINRRYKCKKVQVSAFGVREGYLIEQLL